MKDLLKNPLPDWREFTEMGPAGGIVLMLAAVLAMLMANSFLAPLYDLLLGLPVAVQVGPLEVAKPLLLWINDGLMAIFFFVVGLELKRELLEGHLRDRRRITLPLLGAIGGMLFPALIYVWFNHGDEQAISGWAIPAATDIAFALGVLMLLGDRVPASLKVFLVSLAIIDDIGAILIIAFFYTDKLSMNALLIALPCLALLYILNRRGVCQIAPYLLIGLVMWLAVLKSGVHATLAGVTLALFIPLRRADDGPSPLHQLEDDLKNVVAFGILPLFAFFNAGISLNGVGVDAMLHPVPLGIAAGLFFGKQIGVMLCCWAGVRLGMASLPAGITWRQLYGVAVLSGIGFTMSLFIGSLAFESSGFAQFFDERLGIMVGSLASATWGYLMLRLSLDPPRHAPAQDLEAIRPFN